MHLAGSHGRSPWRDLHGTRPRDGCREPLMCRHELLPASPGPPGPVTGRTDRKPRGPDHPGCGRLQGSAGKPRTPHPVRVGMRTEQRGELLDPLNSQGHIARHTARCGLYFSENKRR